MKKSITHCIVVVFLAMITDVNGQTPIVVGWDFENEAKREAIEDNETFNSHPYTADEGSESNIDTQFISIHGGCTFNNWVQGADGSESHAPNFRNWEEGSESNYWQISFSSLNYEALTISSMQRSSSTGPRDFKLQYSLDETQWIDVHNGEILVADDFVSGQLDNLALPSECSHQEQVFLRWIMTSNTSVNGNSIISVGTSRIDNIRVQGHRICGKMETFYHSELTGNYTDGSFTGNDGVLWHYTQARNEGSYAIDGKGIMLRRASESKIESGVISKGIGSFSLQMRKALTNNNPRQLELYINNEKVGESQVFGTTDEDTTVLSFEVPDINIPGDFTMLIKNVGSTLVDRQTVIDNITWTCYDKPECATTFYSYRSVESGNWEDASIWEASSDDESEWVVAPCPPDYRASKVTIRSPHQVVINEDLAIYNTVIEHNATLIYAGGKLNIMEGPEKGLTVLGILDHDINSSPRLFGQIDIAAGGVLSVRSNAAGLADLYAGNGSAGKVIYQNNSVFEWNNTNIFASANQSYFPDATEHIQPIFRVNMSPSLAIGGNQPTIINGIFQANADIAWQNTGTKTFRNGITGTATVTQTDGCGEFVISGNTAQIGGTGNLLLNANGLVISSPQATLVSNKTINGGPLKITGTLNAGNNTLNLGGDLILQNDALLDATYSTLVLNGNIPQNIILNQPLQLYNLSIDNEKDTFVNNDLMVANTLTMEGGNLILDDNEFTLGQSHSQPGTMIHTSGAVKGNLRRWIMSEVSPNDIEFPVGKNGRSLPISIRFTEAPAAGTLTASFVDINPENYYGNLPVYDDELLIDNLADDGLWNLSAGDGLANGTYNMTITMDEIMQGRITNPESIRILKRDHEEADWEIAGTFNEESSGYSQINHTNITTGFSEFAIGGNSNDNALPIQLMSFTAQIHNKGVQLRWSTASETNNDHFTLQRSKNLQDIVPIGHKQGAGNSNKVLQYEFQDANPLPGINYYRLKQTDFDGTYSYSNWISAHVWNNSGDLEIHKLYQQNEQVHLYIQSHEEENLMLFVTDIQGREVYRNELKTQNGWLQYAFKPISRGLIIITISDGHRKLSKRFIYHP